MLRTVASRNQWILRNTASKTARSVARVLSTQVARTVPLIRASRKILVSQPQQLQAWSTNFVRAYADYPDHVKVALPALSPTMEKGNIVSWEKKEGDKLNEGDLLAEIETDKATMGFETPEEGYLAKIMIPAGTKDVPIGKLVCIIVPDSGSIAAFKDFKDTGGPAAAAPAPAAPAPAAAAPPPPKPAAAAPPPAPKPAAAPPRPSAPAPAPAAGKPMTAVEQRGPRVYASPMAKKLAEAQQLRLEGSGSGLHGSIKSTDLAAMKASKPAAAAAAADKTPKIPQGGHLDIPVSNIRGVIAKRLLESKTTIPHYYVTQECVMDKMLAFRAKVNKKYEKQKIRLSVNDFIIKATAMACRAVPESNSSWMGNTIRQFDNVDVSVAVSTDKGLITPIVFAADRKGVIQISQEAKALFTKARENKLQPKEFQGGTVCVSNMGMFGITHFCAIVNPPQSCILAIGATTKKLISDPDSLKGFKEISVMNVTLSSDHRTVDGAIAAKWMQAFRDYMEDPANMIL